MADSYFHVQLTAILDMLVKSAAVDICALADSVFSSLQREIERCTGENQELRRQLQSFAGEKRSRAHDCRQKASPLVTKSGAPKRDHRLQKPSPASVGVKEEVTEMCVTQSVDNRVDGVSSEVVHIPCSAGTGRNAPLPQLSPEPKTELDKAESVFHSSQPDWKDCSITDYEEDGENSPALEGLQENLDAPFVPSSNSTGVEADGATGKGRPRRDACLPPAPNLQCTFIQIDGTVTASIPHHPARQAGGPVACHICGKRLLSEQRLRVHIKTHSTLRPYTCSQCGKSFTRKATLNFHQNIHRGVKPYACNICPKSFADPSALRRHKSIHKVVR